MATAKKPCKYCARFFPDKCSRHGGSPRLRAKGSKGGRPAKKKNGYVSEQILNTIDALKRERVRIDEGIEALEKLL